MNPIRTARRLDGLGVTLLRRFLSDAPSDAVSLGLGMANVDVPDVIRAALAGAASATRAVYGPNAGDPVLRRLIAESRGVDPLRVIVTTGVEEGIALSMFGLIDPGDEVLVPAPAFPVYATLAKLAGGTIRTYDLSAADRFRPTWSGIGAKVTAATRMVVVCSPGNPTGASASPEEWKAIGEGCAKAGVVVVSDEIYSSLQIDTEHPSMLAHNPEAIVLDGFSKSHSLAGWRLGWMIAPEPLVAPLVALHQHLVTSASTLCQEAARAAFETSEGRAFPEQLKASVAAKRCRALDALVAAGWEHVAGDGAFYLWMRLPGHADDLELATRLMLEAKVVTIPGRAFGDAGKGYLRLSVSAAEDDLTTALTRLCEWTARHATD
ncbi:MAG: aspartate/methionine/tyrosine aminotransferase [Bradymonadia bacterium]|jgi:aspartate/methionine/tyrosine aminotransferase